MAETSSRSDGAQVEWIRPPEWSRRTGMSRTEAYRLMYSGQLQARKIGKMWFIAASELTDFFERMNEAA